MKVYINLSAGLFQDKFNGEIIRIQSSHLESHSFDRLFYGLSDSLLYNLAIGEKCMIVDCSSNKTGKVIKRGIPIIRAVLKKYWFNIDEYSILGKEYRDRILTSLSRHTKKKIKYYKIYAPKEINLYGTSIKVEKEGKIA